MQSLLLIIIPGDKNPVLKIMKMKTSGQSNLT